MTAPELPPAGPGAWYRLTGEKCDTCGGEGVVYRKARCCSGADCCCNGMLVEREYECPECAKSYGCSHCKDQGGFEVANFLDDGKSWVPCTRCHGQSKTAAAATATV